MPAQRSTRYTVPTVLRGRYTTPIRTTNRTPTVSSKGGIKNVSTYRPQKSIVPKKNIPLQTKRWRQTATGQYRTTGRNTITTDPSLPKQFNKSLRQLSIRQNPSNVGSGLGQSNPLPPQVSLNGDSSSTQDVLETSNQYTTSSLAKTQLQLSDQTLSVHTTIPLNTDLSVQSANS